MEREREIAKLVNVLRRIARSAAFASTSEAGPDASRFCAAQYNRVLARLNALEPAVASAFAPLADAAPPGVTRIASRELAAYFEDEFPPGTGRRERCRGGSAHAGW